MSKRTIARIRCLKCNALVLPDLDPLYPYVAYAVVPFSFNKKRGCICSNCIQAHAQGAFNPANVRTGFIEASSEKAIEPAENTSTENELIAKPDDTEKTIENTNLEKEETSTDVDDKESIILEAGTKNDNVVDTSAPISLEEARKTKEFIELFRRYPLIGRLNEVYEQTLSKVFGQDEAAKRLLYAIYTNQNLDFIEENDPTKDTLKRRHVLLIGDTGTGKTFLTETIAKLSMITYSKSNVTPVTCSGYIGESVELLLERLYNAAGNDIEKAQHGILVLDEIDKKRAIEDGDRKDVSGKAVQDELLKFTEPSIVYINKGTMPFNTSNLTVIAAGAFVGLDKVIEKRTKQERHVGFSSEDNTDSSLISNNVTEEDLINYGFTPEFVGRLKVIWRLEKLSREAIINIIYTTLNQYSAIFQSNDFTFTFSPVLIEKIADKVVDAPTGARSIEGFLDAILWKALWEVYCTTDSGACIVNEDSSIELDFYTKDSIFIPPLDEYNHKWDEDWDDECEETANTASN